MKWQNLRRSKNVEDKTNEVTDIPDGTVLAFPPGEIYHSPKKPPEKIVKVQRELGRINREKRNPIPTPRPTDNGTHDNLVTPGTWKTKSK